MCLKHSQESGTPVLKSTDSPEGPYVDKDGATAGSKVLGPGSQLKHVNGINKIFTDANNEFWVYYSAGTAADGNLQRLCLDKLLFGEDGFPYISGYTPSTSEQVAPKAATNRKKKMNSERVAPKAANNRTCSQCH